MSVSPWPDLVFLHFLGGSAGSWARVIACLPRQVRCVAIDLAGFGDAADRDGASVAVMAASVAAAIRREVRGDWMLIGHSMGAKVATVVGRMAENEAEGLEGLRRIVLVAGSPPAPEPMDDAVRQEMLRWFAGTADQSQAEAQTYIERNVARALDAAGLGAAVEDVIRASRSAWIGWLEDGSQEDWSDWVGVLQTPALIIAGADDDALGMGAQARLMARHFADHRLVTMDDTGHLIPMERPEWLAWLIEDHVRGGDDAALIGEPYRALIDSDRVSTVTRRALLSRIRRVGALGGSHREILGAVLARVIPQEGTGIDLVSAVETARAEGDGWRFAALPSDADAWEAAFGMLTLAARERQGRSFVALEPADQDDILEAIAAGKAVAAGPLDATQMKLWFEDLRSVAVRAYMSHPATLARIGYSGIGYGGDGPEKPGFIRVGLGEVEPWEPGAAGFRL